MTIIWLLARNNKPGKASYCSTHQKAIEKNKGEHRKIVTDKLRSYGVAHRELIPEAIHSASSMKIIESSNHMR